MLAWSGGTPDEGWCGGAFGFDIERGSSDGVDLSGTKVALAAEWPGNFFGGNGTARLYIGDSASDAQRRELEAIFSGKKGGLFEGLWGAVISRWLPTETTKVDIGWGDFAFSQRRKFRTGDADALEGPGRTSRLGWKARLPKPHFSLPAWIWPAARAAAGLIRICASGRAIRELCTSSAGTPDCACQSEPRQRRAPAMSLP